jgi:hypothetical protein
MGVTLDMLRTRFVQRSVLCLSLLGLTACGGAGVQQTFPIPEDPGLYAWKTNGELQRIDGPQDWEVKTWSSRSDLDPGTRFIAYDPAAKNAAGMTATDFSLWRVSWLRSEIGADGAAGPRQGSEWVTARLEPFAVQLEERVSRVDPGAVLITPAQPLEPGLYSFQIDSPQGAKVARLGIDWSSVDRRNYSARNCVDAYAGQQESYHLCSAQGEALNQLALDGLEITLVDPLRVGDSLVIQGVVVNTAQQAREVPALEATLRDAQGGVLKRWVFNPGQSRLEPGERLKFKTNAPPTMLNASKVQVSFAKGGAVSGS